MSDNIIEVENISKQYRLGQVSTGTISHDLNRIWHRMRGKEDPYLSVTQSNVRDKKAETLKTEILKGSKKPFQNFSISKSQDLSSDYVWALKDINFEVKRGEVLGIIGRNGAGKSTLLKILSRVTAPTTGEIRVDGRIASLLEVGTGFHPELTGRENIFLNGSILGMTKAEIKSKFDEIIDFSGCERYLDTPVKRYSSGMMVRLGFSVAAHLEPEILVVDEVLAVGDAEFQKKCLGKMEDVAGQGRTVLFVSHNMSAVQKLCPRSIVLQDGGLRKGPIPSAEAVREYLSCGGGGLSRKGPVTFDNDVFHLEDFKIIDRSGQQLVKPVLHDESCEVEIDFSLERYDASFNIGYALYNEDGQLIYYSTTTDADTDKWPKVSVGKNKLRSTIPAWLLNEGDYELKLTASFYHGQWLVHPVKNEISIPLFVRMGAGVSPYWHGKRDGQLATLMLWEKC